MIISNKKENKPCVELKLLDGRTLHDEEIEEEEKKRKKEMIVTLKGHIHYKSSINNPKGLFYYEEVKIE